LRRGRPSGTSVDACGDAKTADWFLIVASGKPPFDKKRTRNPPLGLKLWQKNANLKKNFPADRTSNFLPLRLVASSKTVPRSNVLAGSVLVLRTGFRQCSGGGCVGGNHSGTNPLVAARISMRSDPFGARRSYCLRLFRSRNFRILKAVHRTTACCETAGIRGGVRA